MLRRKQKVVFISRLDKIILFAHGRYYHVDKEVLAERRLNNPRLVILYDAVAGPIPDELRGDSMFGTERPNYIVLATSPRIARFMDWMKLNTKSMTMNYFSRDEVAWLKYVQASCHLTDSSQACQDGLTEAKRVS
jgi:hypothetical protein